MIKFTKNDVPDMELYESRLNRNGFIYVDKQKMKKIVDYEICRCDTLRESAANTMRFFSGFRCADLNRDGILTYLMDYAYCPESFFRTRGTSGYSLDSKKVLAVLYEKGFAKEFLTDYMEHTSLKSKNGKIKGIVERAQEDGGTSKNGTPLSKLYYTASPQQNARFNYKDSDIIAIPKDYNSCITVKDGYALVWGDFAQSDFRIAYNLFIRSEENDEIFNQYEDKYEALARIVAAQAGEVFDYDEFKEERALYKKLTLATMYGTRSSSVPQENQFIRRFSKFLASCPRYVEYSKRVQDRIDLHLPILVRGYFGHIESVPITYDKGKVLDKALNTPIQTGTSEIIILTVNKILDLFYSLGYTEDDVSVYYVRHDEPIFLVKECVLKDAWVFNQVSSIVVDNWTPLTLDFNYGYVYKEVDESLQTLAEANYKLNSSKIDNFSVSTMEQFEEYYPIEPLYRMQVAIEKVEQTGKSLMTLYDVLQNRAAYYLIDSVKDDEISYFIKDKLMSFTKSVYDAGYCGIIVSSKFMEGDAFANRVFIKIIQEDVPAMSTCHLLSRYMLAKYNNKMELGLEVSPILESQYEIIKSVGSLS